MLPAAAAVDWRNTTAEQLGGLPPAVYGASMAYDASDRQAVWFGGCGESQCPGGATYTFANATWTNLTPGLATSPPGNYGAMMDYDPNAGAVVLTGGLVNTSGSVLPTNATWEFARENWTRAPAGCDSPTSATRACRSPMAWAGFAFDGDPSVYRTVLFGGCGTASCLSPVSTPVFANWTYWFNGTTGTWSYRAPSPGSNPSARGGTAMAYDPAAGGLVLFGGVDACGLSTCTENDTWLYANGTWTNVTAAYAPSSSGPPARAFGSMTWDAQLNELVLVGGELLPSGASVNSTEVLACTGIGVCHWSPPSNSPAPEVVHAAMATDSSVLNPILVGGVCSFGCRNSSWVYSALPDLNVAVFPAPQEVGQPVYLNATAVGSLAPTFEFLWGDGTSTRSTSGNGRHIFAIEGVYNATVFVVDPNGSANLHSLQLFVHPGPAALIVVSLPSLDAGAVDYFTAVPVLGTGTLPYNFSWNFGSGPPVVGTSVSHAFASPGDASVVVNFLDALRLPGSTSAVVHVAADPTVVVRPEFSEGGCAVADAGTPTSLFASVVGGTGPFNYTWQFGDGTSGYGLAPSHTFSAGTPTVSLAVTDSGGGAANVAATVHVAPALVLGNLSERPSSPAAGQSATFAVTPTGGDGNTTLAWTFGDGGRSTGSSVDHTYQATGEFVVTVWANDSAGSSTSQTRNVSVTAAVSPVGGFLSSPVLILGILVALGVAVFVAMRWRRRRGGPAGPAPDPEP